MVNSQDTAIAAALTELGYDLPMQAEVLAVTKGSPADGKLEVARPHRRGRRRAASRTSTQVSEAVQDAGVGKPVDVRRTPRRGDRRASR